MPYKLQIRHLATCEIIDAFEWYESQREGLGVEFLDQLDKFYETLLLNPLIFGYYEKPVRQGQLSRFPYLVVYELFDETIVVYSVFMSKQDPAKKRNK